jgi:serine/threonine protein kinase
MNEMTTVSTQPRHRHPSFFNATTCQASFAGYELLRRISGDKADEVFIARRLDDPLSRRRFALKRSCPLSRESSEFFDAFTVESQLLASLEHPTLPPLVDFGELDGWYYLVLELPDGHDLAWIQSACQQQGELLPVELTVLIGREVSDALAYLHEKRDAMGEPLGLSHQDVRPENIFISGDGEILLIPFGIACSYRMESREPHGWLDRHNDYQSPEQHRGVMNDPRSDIYALGGVLRELLQGPSRHSCSREPRAPEMLWVITRKALEYKPNRRYQSARELTIDLLLLIRMARSWRPRERLVQWMELQADRKIDARFRVPWFEAPTRENSVVTRENSVVTRENSVVTRENSVVTRENSVVTRVEPICARQTETQELWFEALTWDSSVETQVESLTWESSAVTRVEPGRERPPTSPQPAAARRPYLEVGTLLALRPLPAF